MEETPKAIHGIMRDNYGAHSAEKGAPNAGFRYRDLVEHSKALSAPDLSGAALSNRGGKVLGYETEVLQREDTMREFWHRLSR